MKFVRITKFSISLNYKRNVIHFPMVDFPFPFQTKQRSLSLQESKTEKQDLRI
jgi:hypothetical protein